MLCLVGTAPLKSLLKLIKVTINRWCVFKTVPGWKPRVIRHRPSSHEGHHLYCVFTCFAFMLNVNRSLKECLCWKALNPRQVQSGSRNALGMGLKWHHANARTPWHPGGIQSNQSCFWNVGENQRSIKNTHMDTGRTSDTLHTYLIYKWM